MRDKERRKVILWRTSYTTFDEIKIEISFKLCIFRYKYPNTLVQRIKNLIHRCKKNIYAP